MFLIVCFSSFLSSLRPSLQDAVNKWHLCMCIGTADASMNSLVSLEVVVGGANSHPNCLCLIIGAGAGFLPFIVRRNAGTHRLHED